VVPAEHTIREWVMRICELKRTVGKAEVRVWPPPWSSSYERGNTLAVGDDEGVLRRVQRVGERLSLTMEYDGREHVGSLEWDAPPVLADVEYALGALIGEEIRAIGEVEVSPSTSLG
jgi:hypothetical protein